MEEMYVFPIIVWKIKGVNTFTKLKTPYFDSLGVKWKLKFLYSHSLRGKVCQIFLKRYGEKLNGLTIQVKAYFMGGATFDKTSEIAVTTVNEWLVWEETEEVMLSKTGYNTVENFLDKKYFNCAIAPTLHWDGKGLCDGKKIEVKSVELSTCRTSLCNDFGKLFNNHTLSDVVLICGGQKIYAHRNILSCRSEVFAAMFRTDLKESKERTVEIEDMEPATLELLVRYMYSGEVLNLTSDSVYQLYAAADKYRVEALKMICGIFMVENSGTANAPTVVESSDENRNIMPKEVVLTHFANIKAVLTSEEWKKLFDKEPKFAHKMFKYFMSEVP